MQEKTNPTIFHLLNWCNGNQVGALFQIDKIMPAYAEIMQKGGDLSQCALYKQLQQWSIECGYDDKIPGIGMSMREIMNSPDIEISEMYGSPKPTHLDTCPVCEKKMESTWLECPFCKDKVSLIEALPLPPEQRLKKCPQCQEDMSPDFKKCPKCGVSLIAAPPPPPPPASVVTSPTGSHSLAPSPVGSGMTMPCKNCGVPLPQSAWQAKECTWCSKDPSKEPEKTTGEKLIGGFGEGMAVLTTGAQQTGEAIGTVRGAGANVQNSWNRPIQQAPPPPPGTSCPTCQKPMTFHQVDSTGQAVNDYYCHSCNRWAKSP